MPTYEYECRACLVHFDRKQSFSDEAIKVCPTCGGETRRVLHPPAIVFKGSGWYITDSRPAPPSEGSSGESTTSGEKSESTPAVANAKNNADSAVASGAKSDSPKSSESKTSSAESSKSGSSSGSSSGGDSSKTNSSGGGSSGSGSSASGSKPGG